MASLGIKSLLVVCMLLTTVSCQSPVLTANQINSGQSVNVTCDANRVVINEPNFVAIASLTIYTIPVGGRGSILATYRSTSYPGINKTVSNIPAGRKWDISYIGDVPLAGTNSNRNTMRLLMNITDTVCDDAGTYICQVMYYYGTGLEAALNASSNLTVQAGVSGLNLIASLPPSGQADYSEYDNITFTCTAMGPPLGITFLWEECAIDVGNLNCNTAPYSPEAPSQSNPSGSASCLQYLWTSLMKIQVTVKDDQKTFRCTVLYNNQAVENKNITVGISGNIPVTGAVSSAGPDVGMIVGIIIGCIAAIALVIIIIFVIRYRKRSKEGNYTGKNDQPDAARDTNLHAPPPVFYPSGKPSKGTKDDDVKKLGTTNEALDTSNDSKDSGSKGPPRYINADADAQGPPRYETETYRGRQNRAYDDEERTRNGRRQPQDQPREQERRHRSRDYDDEPRRRYYSPDDGTDARIDFGNPDIGTSI